MNSLAFFCLPLKVGHVPKRLVSVGADAIIGGSGIGLSGGIGDPGSGSLGSFPGSGSFNSSSGSGASSNLASKGSTSFFGGVTGQSRLGWDRHSKCPAGLLQPVRRAPHYREELRVPNSEFRVPSSESDGAHSHRPALYVPHGHLEAQSI